MASTPSKMAWASRFISRITHFIAINRSEPAECVSGFSAVILGIWFVLPASHDFLLHQNFQLVNEVAPLPAWGIWLIALAIMQWIAVLNNSHRSRVSGIWLIMMTRIFLLILVGHQTNYDAAFVPQEIGFTLLAVMAYLHLRL